MKKFSDFYESYNYLSEHKICKSEKYANLSMFERCLSIEVVKVNPKTFMIETDKHLNTLTRVWLEFGGWDNEDDMPIHDIDLDTGADTFEEAIIKLANLVWNKYDN